MLFLFILACGEEAVKTILEPSADGEILTDNDGDGFLSDEDCDDSDPQINPGAEELCDGFDNNCNNQADEDVTESFFVDSDGDGFGNANISTEACEAPSGFVSNGTDCDDAEELSYPGAEELCDGMDNDCNDEIDEGMGQVFYADADGDGFGSADAVVEACQISDGLSTLAEDCDDLNPDINPLAQEQCDEVDNNCDGQVDEGVTSTFYLDEMRMDWR